MRQPSLDQDHWSRVAQEWIAWARAPDHDAFWRYREAFARFVGTGTGTVLDIGCGEGRVSRELKALGYRVTAADPVRDFVEAARQADSAHAYAVAGAADLPFETGSFDRVIAYNMLMDVEDVPGAAKEIGRVLRPTGTLIVSIVHPFTDRGRFADEDPDAAFVLTGSYFGRQRFEGTEERDGLAMRFAGWSQPLEAYVAALAGAGLAVTALAEPRPDCSGAMKRLERWTRVPLFLWLKARPLAG
ncbi:class I SAM-dependent methyltransferase [Consotaella aegiceratis]|uniref:class I SAM-dependent methyltransferase n=1 Tax=Consotaella aegiceratis TaxID=3097961 RepID=UPI002F3EE53F